MKKSDDRTACVITVNEEDGSSREIHLSQDVYERMLAAWKLCELQLGRSVCFHELVERLAEGFLADRRSAEAE